MSAIAPRRSVEASLPNLNMTDNTVSDNVTTTSSDQEAHDSMPKPARHEESDLEGRGVDAWAPAEGVHVREHMKLGIRDIG